MMQKKGYERVILNSRIASVKLRNVSVTHNSISIFKEKYPLVVTPVHHGNVSVNESDYTYDLCCQIYEKGPRSLNFSNEKAYNYESSIEYSLHIY